MRKIKSRSQASVAAIKSNVQVTEEVYAPPLDVLDIKVLHLIDTDECTKHYTIKVTFFDQLLISGVIKSVGARQPISNKSIAKGCMNFDPSDYEKMCLMADCPLNVSIQRLKFTQRLEIIQSGFTAEFDESSTSFNGCNEISCCNIDILPLFIDKDKMLIKKRLEPMIELPLLQRKSWNNLPLLTIELSMIRNELNGQHHKLLTEANCMQLTLVAAYNMRIPIDDDYVFTAASKLPLYKETNSGLVTYNQGHRIPNRFDHLNFISKWEILRTSENVFTKSDNKFACELENIQTPSDIDIEYYMTKSQSNSVVVWGSFHRTLIIGHDEKWFSKQIRRYSWPFEVHMYGDHGGLSYMSFLNLFHLLYPGEHTVRMAVPLLWVNADDMLKNCNCDLLLTPNLPSSVGTPKPKYPTDSIASVCTDVDVIEPTGVDGNSAFIVIEIKLTRPLKKPVIPPTIPNSEINSMLEELEQESSKRKCSGRGQLDQDWQATVRAAEISLRKVPHYGMTEFCIFNRQLSETRIRVELMTSFWLDAAVYVNNNFVVQEFLSNEDLYEEMLMMSHACLTGIACNTLLGNDNKMDLDPTLRAARHARQMQDIPHAVELYLQVVTNRPRGANSWRELSACLKEVDVDWANVCLNKSIVLDPRHPITLLSKGCMVYDEDSDAAEPFFVAIITYYPFWVTGWVIAHAYYSKRELFNMADVIMQLIKKNEAEGLVEELPIARSWGSELGDWWDPPPLLPGMSRYFTATDLLLRLRAISLAEVCLSRAIAESGETAAALQQVALCCRLRGDLDEALCHLQLGIDKFGDINFLRALQAECYHKQKNVNASMASFEKSGSCLSAYSADIYLLITIRKLRVTPSNPYVTVLGERFANVAVLCANISSFDPDHICYCAVYSIMLFWGNH